MSYRDSSKHSPIEMFWNSNSADTINNRGDVTFNLQRNITLPNDVIGFCSLSELTKPNTIFNIHSRIHVFSITNGSTLITKTQITHFDTHLMG